MLERIEGADEADGGLLEDGDEAGAAGGVDHEAHRLEARLVVLQRHRVHAGPRGVGHLLLL